MAISCQKPEAFGQDLFKNHHILGWKAAVEDSRFRAKSPTFQEVTFSSVYQTPTWPYKKWGIGIQFMVGKAKGAFLQKAYHYGTGGVNS